MKNYLLARVSAAFAAASIVSAVPVPVSGPVAGSGDGLNVRMVQYNSSLVHSIAAAETALALSPGDAEHASEVNDIVNHIDIADGNYGGEITPTHDSVPFGTPDRFAIRFSGYLNVIEGGSYTFRSYTDDGFRLTLGGEVISLFDGDRGPAASINAVVLVPGLYPIELISWDQGGAFVNELAWLTPGVTAYEVPGSEVFFTTVRTSVPDAGSTGSMLIGAAAMFLSGRRFRRSR